VENLERDMIKLLERNSNILYSLLEFLDDKGIVKAESFLDFCASLEKDSFSKEIYRSEEDTRSVRDNLHPGGIKATLELCESAGMDRSKYVLDAGTGHGGAARVIAENYGCRVTGIDMDYVRLVNAIFRTRAMELEGLVDFRLVDAYKMSFESDVFDIIIRQHSIYGGEEAIFIRECGRVLKPGGVIAFQGILKRMSLGGCKMKMEDYSLEEYSELLRTAGFIIKSVETEKETQALQESLTDSNPAMVRMIDKKLITGIRLIAERGG